MKFSDRGKMVIGYSIAGIVFAILTTISIAVLNATPLGLGFDNNVQGLISALFSGDIMAMILTAITAIIFGVFIWIFGYVGASLRAKVSGGTVKLQKRPHLIGLFLMGILGVGIFGIVDQILAGVGTSTDPIGLIAFDNPLGIVVQFIAYSFLGFAVIWLGSKFTSLEKPLPDTVKKI